VAEVAVIVVVVAVVVVVLVVVVAVVVVVVAVRVACPGLSPVWFFQQTNKTHGAGAPRSTPATRDFHPLGFGGSQQNSRCWVHLAACRLLGCQFELSPGVEGPPAAGWYAMVCHLRGGHPKIS